MLIGYLDGLLTAWVLGWFGLHNILIELIQPFMSIDLTKTHYYIVIGFIGMIGGAFDNTAKINTD